MNPTHKNDDADSKLMLELFKRVNARVNSISSTREKLLIFKLILFVLAYIACYSFAVFVPGSMAKYYVLFAFIGILSVLIFANFIHEACHENLFKSKRANRLVFRLFDFIGANSFIWRQRHLVYHHRYPNTMGWDTDIEQSGPIAIYPHQPLKRYHRYQHIYIFLMYPFFLLNWLLVRDFKDYFGKDPVVKKLIKIPRREYIRLFVFKSLFIFMMIGMPVLMERVSFSQAFLGLLIMCTMGSFTGLVILLTAHVNTESHFPEIDENSEIEVSWFRQQFLTVNDMDADNWFVRHILGSFNYHLSHHLFPGISSIYAPEVTDEIRKFAAENDLPYRTLSFTEAFRMHYGLIRQNARMAEKISA